VAVVEEEVSRLRVVVVQDEMTKVVVEEVQRGQVVREAAMELSKTLVVVAAALTESLAQEVEVVQVLDLEVVVVPLRVRDFPQTAEARQTWIPLVSLHRVRVSWAVAAEVEGLDLQHWKRLALCSAAQGVDLRISLLLRVGVVL
jgi:hypothetical protein